MRPELRKRAAGIMIIVTLIGWPLSAFTFAANEPQFILGLSWLAITLTAVDIYATTDVRKEIDE
jgi:hypothetical protein